MLSRDQVLHVARLARLELNEEKQQRMSEELSTVFDHFDKFGALRAERLGVSGVMVPGNARFEGGRLGDDAGVLPGPAKGNVGLFKATGGVSAG